MVKILGLRADDVSGVVYVTSFYDILPRWSKCTFSLGVSNNFGLW